MVYYANSWKLTKIIILIKTVQHVTLQHKLINGLTPAYQLTCMIESCFMPTKNSYDIIYILNEFNFIYMSNAGYTEVLF